MDSLVPQDTLEEAVALLKDGQVVAFPTETVYGLGADASNSDAVKKIYDIKSRPTNHPLIVHLANAEQVRLWVRDFPDNARKLAEAFWPGPLTMIMYKNGRVADEAVAGSTTVAIRVPNHPVALQLLEEFDGGLAGPSANKFGQVSPTSANHVKTDLGNNVAMVLDGGKCSVGIESTIIDMTSEVPEILRPGGITRSQIEDTLGIEVNVSSEISNRASGMTKSHYSPKANVILIEVTDLDDLEEKTKSASGIIAPISVEGFGFAWQMPQDAEAYSKSLYAVFREADERRLKTVYVIPPSEGEMLPAVVDRLTKASA